MDKLIKSARWTISSQEDEKIMKSIKWTQSGLPCVIKSTSSIKIHKVDDNAKSKVDDNAKSKVDDLILRE